MSKRIRSRKLAPIHPGEQLADILNEAGLTANSLALKLSVPSNQIGAIVSGKRSITADMALRLEKLFGSSPQFWMNLQTKYDLDKAFDDAAQRTQRVLNAAAPKSESTKNGGS